MDIRNNDSFLLQIPPPEVRSNRKLELLTTLGLAPSLLLISI